MLAVAASSSRLKAIIPPKADIGRTEDQPGHQARQDSKADGNENIMADMRQIDGGGVCPYTQVKGLAE